MGGSSGRCCNISTAGGRKKSESGGPAPRLSTGAAARSSSKEVFEIQGMREYKLRYKEKGAVRKHARVSLLTSADLFGQYVCRKIKFSDMPCQDMAGVSRHLAALGNLEHPHICRFIEAFEDRETLYMVYERANPRTLFEHVTEKSSLTEEEAADYMRQVTMAMAVAHGQGIVHGRFSPRCLILADDDQDDECDTQIQICDMGQVFIVRPDMLKCEDSGKLLEVQRYAISPEVASQDLKGVGDGVAPRGSDKSDMWALGVVFYHMLAGHAPFKVTTRDQLVTHLGSKSIKFQDSTWANLSNSARDLIEQMMKLNPGLRISAAQTLKHPWVMVAKATFPKNKMVQLLRDMHSNVEECEFKRFVLRVIAEQLPGDGKHVSTVENAYRCLDRNGDGILSVEEVIKGLKKHLHKGADDRELEDLFAQIDRDGSGTISVQEFVTASMPQCRSTSLPVLWEAFNAFDKDRSAHVTFDEVDRIVREIEGSSLNKDILSAVCRGIRAELENVGSAGGIDFDQFVYIMKNAHPNFADAVQKDWSRWLWEACSIDNYNVRHINVKHKWDICQRRGARSAYRRGTRGRDDVDEAG